MSRTEDKEPTCYRSESELSLEALLALPRRTLWRNWDGTKSELSQDYLLALDPAHIYLLGFFGSGADFDSTLRPGEFAANLWQRDVLELFIKDDDSGAYQEFNLSPGAAWWTAVFDAPRKKREPKEEGEGWSAVGENVSAGSRELEGGELLAWMRIRRSSLFVSASFAAARTRWNVTACKAGKGKWERGREGRVYLSLAKLAGEVADFHQPECFVGL